MANERTGVPPEVRTGVRQLWGAGQIRVNLLRKHLGDRELLEAMLKSEEQNEQPMSLRIIRFLHRF